MVILDAGHPDILEFIECKTNEEKKAWALIEAGLRRQLHRRGLRLGHVPERQPLGPRTDEFMRAVEDDGDWTTHAVVDGEPMDTYKARDIFRRDGRGGLALRRPGHPVRHDHQRLAHLRQHGPDQRQSNPCSEYMFLDDTACNLACST